MEHIKSYRPENNSISSGQVLQHPYEYEKGRLIAREMTDLLVLDLVEKGLVTDQMELTVGYDIANLTDPARRSAFKGTVTADWYGREVPKMAHGSINLPRYTASTKLITEKLLELYARIVDENLLVRRMYVVANHVIPERDIPPDSGEEQLDLFRDYAAEAENKENEETALQRERSRQKAILGIKHKYGKNAILKGMNLEEGATTMERNRQVGGHRA